MSLQGKVALVTGSGQGIGHTEKVLGGFDIMVNNAGIAQVQALADVTPEELDRIHKINVGGTLWGIQAAAKKFIARKQKAKSLTLLLLQDIMALVYLECTHPLNSQYVH